MMTVQLRLVMEIWNHQAGRQQNHMRKLLNRTPIFSWCCLCLKCTNISIVGQTTWSSVVWRQKRCVAKFFVEAAPSIAEPTTVNEPNFSEEPDVGEVYTSKVHGREISVAQFRRFLTQQCTSDSLREVGSWIFVILQTVWYQRRIPCRGWGFVGKPIGPG
jgi:hypothetical protein